MIIVLFGQPGSGKTTLAKELLHYKNYHHIDGDELRTVFCNKDYSKQGRLDNLKRASDIAHYLNQHGNVILSLIYPYKEARDYLNSLTSDVKWFLLETLEDRGKSDYQVNDFDYSSKEENIIYINTSNTIQKCVDDILNFT